jgi:hypothetical protein
VPFSFRPDLKVDICSFGSYFPIRTSLKYAFNTLPLILILSEGTKLKSSYHPMTGHEDPEV